MKAFTLPTIFTAIDRLTAPVDKMNKALGKFSKSAMQVSRNFAIAGAAVLAPLALMANDAVKFDDKMADIAKTTGLQGAALTKFGDDILDMSMKTRTSIEDLQTIAEIGGQLGIAEKDLLAFTDSANKFNVALGKDFSGGVEQAVSSVGKIRNLFSDTKSLNVSDAIMKTGSAINALGAVGEGTSENITEFTLRLGALPGTLKPVATDTLALGTYFEELGIDARIASSGMTGLLTSAATSLPAFSKQMGITEEAAKNLLNTDPTEFAKKFSASLKGMSGVQVAKTLQKLEIGNQEVIKVVGALGANTDRLTELQKISNEAFEKGTSLAIEYGTKNETMAGKIQRAENNFKALSITIGTQLLPLIGDLLTEITPIIKSFVNWIRENKGLVKTILKVTAVIGGLLLAISAISAIIAGVVTVYGWWITAQWALNAAAMAFPGTYIIGFILLIIAAVALVIKYWDEWGAAFTMLIGIAAAFFSPVIAAFAVVISLVMSFVRNWDMITQAFKEGGILAGLKAIGVTLLDAVLYPLEQILGIVAKITGADWAASAAKGIKDFRANLGVDVGGAATPTQNYVTPMSAAEEQAQDKDVALMRQTTQNQNTTLTIQNQTGNKITTESDNSLIDIKMGSTMTWGQRKQ